MVRLVFFLQPLQDFDRVIDRRLVHLHLLETTFKCRVFFNVFAILIKCGGTDTLQLSPAESRLDDVRSIHRSLSGTCTDDGVEFIDEQNNIFHLTDFIHDCFDTLLKLATVFRTRDHKSEVKSDDLFVAKNLRDVARRDFLGEALDDGGLAYAGFSDEDRIIFRAAAEDLNHAFDFAFAADHGIESTFASDLGEIAAECFQRGCLRLCFSARGWGLCLGFVLEGPVFGVVLVIIVLIIWREIRIDFREDLVASTLDVNVEALEYARGDAFALTQQPEQKMLGSDVRMVECLGLLVCESEHFFHPWSIGNISSRFLGRTGSNFFFHLHAYGLEFETHPFEDVDRDPLAEFDQTKQQMLSADVGVVESVCFFTSKSEDLLSAWGEVVHESLGLGVSMDSFASLSTISLSGDSRNCKRARTISARIESRSSGESFLPE